MLFRSKAFGVGVPFLFANGCEIHFGGLKEETEKWKVDSHRLAIVNALQKSSTGIRGSSSPVCITDSKSLSFQRKGDGYREYPKSLGTKGTSSYFGADDDRDDVEYYEATPVRRASDAYKRQVPFDIWIDLSEEVGGTPLDNNGRSIRAGRSIVLDRSNRNTY